MTLNPADLATMASGPHAASADSRTGQLGASPDAAQSHTAEAARQFEQLVVQQLFQVLRKSLPNGGLISGNGPGTHMYGHMIDQAMSEQLTAAGGIGLRGFLEESMGGRPQSPTQEPVGVLGTLRRFDPFPFRPDSLIETDRADGARDFHSVAREMIDRNSARRWAREGKLTPEDMTSDFTTEETEGIATFNVRDAGGYIDQYKCNLFAFEFARRAGYQVPVAGRHRGWGYPEPNTVTDDAQDGQLRGDWGRVVTGASVEAYNRSIEEGHGAYMLTGSGYGGRSGHMGVIERVHSIDYDDAGNVERIVFDGWEARPDGARHLTQRTWNRRENFGGNDPRNGFVDIEIIQLRTPAPGERSEVPTSHRAGASVLDNLYSSADANRPNDGSEENR